MKVGRWGTPQSPVATAIADQSTALFRAHSEISVVFAPWDEFAVAPISPWTRMGSEANSASTAGIYRRRTSPQCTSREGNALLARAAINPAVVGAVSVRIIAPLLAGGPGQEKSRPARLGKPGFLLKGDIKTVQALEKTPPALAQSPGATAAWMQNH
jgi:simple sugar transport system substrate-binding protein